MGVLCFSQLNRGVGVWGGGFWGGKCCWNVGNKRNADRPSLVFHTLKANACRSSLAVLSTEAPTWFAFALRY